MNITIKQGEDLKVELPILDNQNNPIDLTTATKIRLGLFIKNQSIKKYMDDALETLISGYGSVSVNTLKNNIIDILFLREDTILFPIGTMNISVLLEFPDVDLTDKRYEFTYTIGQVIKGELKGEILT